MSVQNPERLATKQDLADMYQGILPYLGGMPEMLANKFSKGDLYDTSEKMIGKWINGKPLYQRVIEIDNPTKASNNAISPSIDSSFDLKQLNALGRRNINETYIYYYNAIGTSQSIAEGLYISDIQKNSVYIDWKVASGIFDKVILILKYIKTTDSVISIGSDTDYSTEEKIVGTWIDGKPVWQKTFITTLSKSGNFYRSDTDVSGLAINDVLEITGIVKGVDSGHTFHVSNGSSFSGDTANAVSYYIYDNTLTCLTNSSSYNGGSTRITIQYTKTTGT